MVQYEVGNDVFKSTDICSDQRRYILRHFYCSGGNASCFNYSSVLATVVCVWQGIIGRDELKRES